MLRLKYKKCVMMCNGEKTMKALNYVVAAVVVLSAVAAVYGQNTHKSKARSAKTSAAPKTGLAKQSYSVVSHSAVALHRHPPTSVGAISAFPPDAQAMAEDKAAHAPSDAFYQQAKTLYQSGDFKGAEEACLNALNVPPVIHGQTQYVPFVANLLGQIYLKDGQYEKAIQWLQGSKAHTVGGTLNLDLALAYLRLGDYKQAQECYSDQATLRYYPQGDSSDLPGTDSPDHLEASILLARGLDAYLEHRYDDALPDLQRANTLAPSNALIAYHCAKILDDKGHYSEATALYKIAAATGRGIISEDAKRRSGSAGPAVAPSNQPLR